MIRFNHLSLAASLCLAASSAAGAQTIDDQQTFATGPLHVVATTRPATSPQVLYFNQMLTRAEQPKEKGPFLGVSASPVPAVLRDQLKLQPGVGLVVDF